MYQVGLTGGIGSGKTLVCNVLEKLGVPVYYADSAARRLMNSNADLINKIVGMFGNEAYKEESINRLYLAEQVFGNPQKLSDLNSVVHPVVREDYNSWAISQKDAPYVVEEAAILFESGANRFMDEIVWVYAPDTLRIKRVMERDGVDEKSVRRRMKYQMDDEERKGLADYIIHNDETEMLLPQIITMHTKLLNSR